MSGGPLMSRRPVMSDTRDARQAGRIAQELTVLEERGVGPVVGHQAREAQTGSAGSS